MKIDPNAEYDWLMLGRVSPKVRKALERYGFVYNSDNGYWMRLSKDGLPGETDLIMDMVSEEAERLR